MRPSKRSHTLAILRLAINAKMTQKELADLLDCSVDTVQSIETGRLRISENMARKISHATAVNLNWLLDDDVTKPIINHYGTPYTKANFEERQAQLVKCERLPDADDAAWVILEVGTNFAKVAAILLRGVERSEFDTYLYRLRKALREVYFDDGEYSKNPGSWNWMLFGGAKVLRVPMRVQGGGSTEVITLAGGIRDAKPTMTRPDLKPYLDAFESRFKELLAAKEEKKKRVRPVRRGA